MERELPTVKIGGTDFIVDIRNKEFREMERQTNKIPFGKVFDSSDAVAINYDKRTRNVYEGSWVSFLYANHTESVHLPPFIELDREGVKEAISKAELHKDAALLKRKEKQDTQVPSSRMIPKLEIEGSIFFYDRIGSHFRQADNAFNKIPESELFLIDTGELGLLYDSQTKKPFRGTYEQYEQRTGLRLVEIPSLDLMNKDNSGKIFTTVSRPAKLLSQKQYHHRGSLPKMFTLDI